MTSTFDVIVIGAGSVGLPTAFFLAREGVNVLVLEELASHGQGQNKAAIGGVRATHSDPAKIQTCQLSLEVFSHWRDQYGDDIHFLRGGYCFPVYEEDCEWSLKNLLAVQKQYGLTIDWLDAADLIRAVPGINPAGLRGGTYSPLDGSVSPILASSAFYRQAVAHGAKFRFSERVTAVKRSGRSAAITVKTDRGTYEAGRVINAAGANAREVGRLMGLDLPVFPDSHEAGVTEPVKPFIHPMVVDIRGYPGSTNFYFYQEEQGHIIFCLTPEPIIPGHNRDSSSGFLPQAARRMIALFPRLRNIRVRRVWRGLYPMTPDGVPIVDRFDDGEGLYVAAGFCGQGLMLGPGIARNLVSLITTGKPIIPEDIFRSFSLKRDYSRPSEALK
ncbi:MAG TPA: FAD-binding oxidoreductase [bacterium]|nr:FAD-binding oxidoreductase [bacterium]